MFLSIESFRYNYIGKHAEDNYCNIVFYCSFRYIGKHEEDNGKIIAILYFIALLKVWLWYILDPTFQFQ